MFGISSTILLSRFQTSGGLPAHAICFLRIDHVLVLLVSAATVLGFTARVVDRSCLLEYLQKSTLLKGVWMPFDF